MTRIEKPEKHPSFLGNTPSESAAYRAAAMATARRYYERDKEHYAKADADGYLIPLPMDHSVLGELLSHIDHLTAQLTAKDQERKDLAMLVRRLCHALSKTRTHPKVQEQSLDYLKRKGLQGDILRGGDDDAKH